MNQIVVIGGGISGITAALETIKQSNFSVQLLEASGRLGGVLESIHHQGMLIERSADNFSTVIPDALELSKECGLYSDLIQPNEKGRQAFVFFNGQTHPIPTGFSLMQPTRIGAILRTKLLSPSGKLRLLGEYFVPPRAVGSQDALTDESLEEFAIRRLGREGFERLVEPIVSGIFTADPTTLSMAATMPQFVEMERRHGGLIRGYLAAKKQDAAAAARKASGARYDQFLAPRLGMSSWIDGLSRQLPEGCVRLNCPVTSLNKQAGMDGRWTVTTQDGSRFHADGVILATPASTTAKLIANCAPDSAEIVAGIPYASSVVVAMVIDKRELHGRIDGFGLIVPRCERRRALAISITSNKYPGRTPDDQVLLRVFLGGALQADVMDLTDAQLESMAATEIRDILRWTGNGLRWQAVIRWNHAMPQYLVGHVDRMDKLGDTIARFKTLQLCGAAYRGVGIPQCVRNARQAALQLSRNLREREQALSPNEKDG